MKKLFMVSLVAMQLSTASSWGAPNAINPQSLGL